MKKLMVLLFAFLIYNLTFNIENSMSQWQPDVRLTNALDSSRTLYHNSNLISNGNIVHTAWYDRRDGNFEIYYKRSTDVGVTWGNDIRLTNSPGNSIQPSCAVNGSIVHISWCDDRSGIYQVYYKRSTDAGITWSSDTLLTNTVSMSLNLFPHLASSGMLMFVVWHDNRDGNYEIYYKRSTNGGVDWGADTRLTNDPSSSNIPSVSISGSNVHIVWYDNREGNNEIYYKYSANGGISWDVDTRLTNALSSSQVPNIVVSGSNLHVVWYDQRDGNWEIYYKRSVDGGINWDADTRLTNDLALSTVPLVVISGLNVHIIWHDQRDGNWEIYYKLSTNNGSNWGTDTRLTYDPASSFYPSISISNSVLNIVWTDDRDGNYEIYYKRNPTGNPVGIVNNNSEIPNVYSLYQNYPNPFNPTTKIKFDVPSGFPIGAFGNDKVVLKVYDVMGREVQMLVNESLKPGTYETTFDGSQLSSGVYFYKLTVVDPTGRTGDFSDIKKMLIIK